MQTALPPAAAPARPASEVAGPQMSCAVCPFRLRAHTLDCSLLSCLPFFFSFPLAPTSSANRLSSTSARIRLLSALRAGHRRLCSPPTFLPPHDSGSGSRISLSH